jgi:hypothetical protein
MRTGKRCAAVAVATTLVLLLAGCGTPGAPQPPSLNLPDPITDLSAFRTGSQVSLTWTMPRRNTDKLPLKTIIPVRVCRREEMSEGSIVECASVGELQLAPGSDGSFTDTLPAQLCGGAPRSLKYYVELKNRKGRSAGLSNAATVLAGEAPAPVTGLAAEVRKAGVVLRWAPDSSGDVIRVRRTLLTPSPAKPHTGPLPGAPEPIEQNLLIEPNATANAQALDKNITLGNTYEYRAQRLVRESVNGEAIELAGEFSPPIRVQVLDVFPPAVPAGLAAVATAPDSASGVQASIDLSWQPNTEADLAGYEVYRREDSTPWQRISGDQPVVGPAFHDANVLAGHTYRYGVSAVDKGGRESGRSEEAHETVPNP